VLVVAHALAQSFLDVGFVKKAMTLTLTYYKAANNQL